VARKVKDWIEGYVRFLENSEAPDIYKTWTAISTVAAVLQRKVSLPWGTITFYPNMYIILTGPSGCRKGTAMGPAYKMLNDLGVKTAAEAITREALIRELKNSAVMTADSDTNISYHSSLSIVSAELTVFLGYNNVQLMSDLTDWYDCRDRWIYRTKSQGTDEIIGVWVNLIGATTPSLIQSTLPRDAIGGGLTSRMIFVYAARKGKSVATPFLSSYEMQLREDLVVDLERIGTLKGEYQVDESFLDVYVPWYGEQDKNPIFTDIRFGGYNERRANHLLKLSMILNASRSDGNMVLTDHDFNKAKKIISVTESVMPNVFSGIGKNDVSDVLSNVMTLVATKGTISFSDIMKEFYFDADKATMETIIDTLESMKFLQKVHSKDKGWFVRYLPQK